jgi:hypothetical protein
MSQRPPRRVLAAFALASIVTLLPAASSQAAPERGGRSEAGFTARLEEPRGFSLVGFLVGLWEMAGVRIDDNGIW